MSATPRQSAIRELVAGTEPLTIGKFSGGGDPGAADVLKMGEQLGVRMVDFKFTDVPGTWQHMALSINCLDEDAFSDGLGFDGSSIRGFQQISESDMLLMPDASTAMMDPFYEERTLSLICNVIDPITRQAYSRDPRYVAQKAERHLTQSAVADTAFFGPEAEFYIFDHVSFDQQSHKAYYEVDTAEAYWNRGAGFGVRANNPNVGHHPRSQEGYFPTPPLDTLGDLRALNGYALLSDLALSYVAGVLDHGRALMAFCAPTSNSYRRLVPGYEAPVNLVHSQRNRSAAVRIPMYLASPKAKRIEFRPPDPLTNPYLGFSALLMAGLDGIKRGLKPGKPVDTDLFDLSKEELAQIVNVPGSLAEAMDALGDDHAFLLEGDVFTQDLIEEWISYKRAEAKEIDLRPHPWEFVQSYDG
jgi:glutamine synthetase